MLELALLGEWQISAKGIWKVENELVAKVSFNAFEFEAINLFGQPSWSLPSIKVPVWELLRNEAMWTTSYLDSVLRIGRGATGNMFVFRRQS